ncbi:DNA repair protein RecO [Sphingomicrobium astaxanthinifaciens]|uniref:DNA repair protein RecO n=1 Tax=Sphingomicrobium astaxanthinifaciens TaxID=1227949 RepID=UPI001FCC3B1E|nr:DNA repair protein RecO [Sphingomicrobium astaxanthinifaciens]MCJ7420320.1 DNA repair protein RecO [Sphingomicrobium astaxanthinifaciens]
MRRRVDGILVAVRAHGERGAVVRLFTVDEGLLAAYVRGAHGRRLGPVLLAGNEVAAELSARNDNELPQARLELRVSRGALLGEPLPAAAIEWLSALTAAVLPERQPYPTLHAALGALLAAIERAASARDWASALVRYELTLLAELGYGLDLSGCAVSGDNDHLVAVSPRSGRAVGAAAAGPYAGRLLPLPAFLLEGGRGDWGAVLDGLALSGHFLERDLLVDRAAAALSARERLLSRLRRAAGLA